MIVCVELPAKHTGEHLITCGPIIRMTKFGPRRVDHFQFAVFVAENGQDLIVALDLIGFEIDFPYSKPGRLNSQIQKSSSNGQLP